ncbi:hypothetical protein ACQI5H_08610 [Mycobacterium heidelbergense]|uniref:hypothetical protein n=1 Tax=Mycobacterium heidelbergense TaxID=53376 RepID=UPI003CEEBC9C
MTVRYLASDGPSGGLVKHANRGKWRWLVSVVAVGAVVWALAAVGAHGRLLSAHHHVFHPSHPLLSSLSAEFAANVDQAHVVDGSTHSHHPEEFAGAVLPQRAATALVALGVVVAALTVAGLLGTVMVPTGRGPPWAPARVLAGQHLLTRLCLTRR